MRKEFHHERYFWKADIDYRAHPNQYRVGKGEQGVLLCEPYKSEILPFWRFRTPDLAAKSSNKILEMFYAYLKEQDFIGADMARKFLQMGFTRSRRYVNYKGGRKYHPETHELNPKGTGDPLKKESAAFFYNAWKEAENDPIYHALKLTWKRRYG